jgi:hypothetical protein
VELSCAVNVHGLPEGCRVVSEKPTNMGFGAAALLLTPDFLFKPATVNGRPVPGDVRIPVHFKPAPGAPAGPLPLPGDRFTFLNHPTWSAAPTFADIAAAYPASGAGPGGYSAFRCEVDVNGALKKCDLLREEPSGKGFGRAARGLIGKFRMVVQPDMAAIQGPKEINLPIRLIDPSGPEFTSRRLGEPTWIKVLDPSQVQAVFPSEAAGRGLTTGLGVASCTVGADGYLKDCAPARADPEGLGFAEAAVKVASVLQINLWTQEGGPVDGAKLQLPIRFKLADKLPAKAAP